MINSYKNQIDVAQQLIKKITIPVLSDSVIKLQNVLNSSDTPNPTEIKACLSESPYLSGELVALANFYALQSNLSSKITDLETAIIRLGSNAVKNFVLAIEIKKHLDKNRIASLSSHSQRIARIIYLISKRNKTVKPDEAYLIGLLHDIGAFDISELDQVYGQQFIHRLNEHYQLENREVANYGTTHAAMGYVLARSWQIPSYIAHAILLHHSRNLADIENKKLRNILAMIEFAHSLEIRLFDGAHEKPLNQEVYTMCQNLLELTDEQVNEIQLDIKKEV